MPTALIRTAVMLTAAATVATMVTVTALPAAADERYVGKLCFTFEVPESGRQKFQVCDTQYDSTSLDNHRIHYVTAKPLTCPVLANWWRLRSATNGGTVDTVKEEVDGCSIPTTVTSGPKRATTTATILLHAAPLDLTESASFRPL
ncbi:hypothetical protein [Kribbella sp. NPDC004875]|uniref:hypothetical protein n=1 Tax=Kribbella sp. NPDC004875 TaxID=3364107 RepID=UPI00367A4212